MASDNIITTDKVLLELIANNDQRAFDQFFKSNYHAVYTIAFRLTRSKTLANEILQEIFLEIWLKRSSILEIENINAYIYVSIQNRMYNALKKLAREKRNLNEYRDTMPVETIVENRDPPVYEEILATAIENLPEKQRKTYKLVKQNGMKREEAAKIMNVSGETIKSNLKEAINNIKNFVKGRKVLVFILMYLLK